MSLQSAQISTRATCKVSTMAKHEGNSRSRGFKNEANASVVKLEVASYFQEGYQVLRWLFLPSLIEPSHSSSVCPSSRSIHSDPVSASNLCRWFHPPTENPTKEFMPLLQGTMHLLRVLLRRSLVVKRRCRLYFVNLGWQEASLPRIT